MASRWQQVPIDRARRHPLYGVGGWLVVFAVGLALAVLQMLGGIRGTADRAGMTVGDFFSIDDPAIAYMKLALALHTCIVAAIYWLLFSKHSNFRPVTTGLLLIGWPAVLLLALAQPFPGVVYALAQSLFSWALGCAVWVTYLQRSQRVRVTFEHSVVATVANAQNSLPLVSPEPAVASIVAPDWSSLASSQRPLDPRDEAPFVSVGTADEFWATALAELESNNRRPGLWARSFAEARGDDARARASYLSYRARELEQQAAERRAQVLTESAARRHANELRASVELEEIERYRRSVKELDTATEVVLLSFVESVPQEHAVYVFSAKNEVGGTLLHTAAREGFIRLAELLLRKGADPSIAGPKGLRPHQVAARNGHYRLAERLEYSLNAQPEQPPSAALP